MPMTNWRTGSGRSCCRGGGPARRCARCWPAFAASFPLRGPSAIVTVELAGYLLTRSEGTIGEPAHLLTDAAFESGEESINQRTLLMAGYAGLAERRRLFERELA